jgi:hypothetical protein
MVDLTRGCKSRGSKVCLCGEDRGGGVGEVGVEKASLLVRRPRRKMIMATSLLCEVERCL